MGRPAVDFVPLITIGRASMGVLLRAPTREELDAILPKAQLWAGAYTVDPAQTTQLQNLNRLLEPTPSREPIPVQQELPFGDP